MAGKSKRGRHLPRSKRKGRKFFAAPAAKPAAAKINEPVPAAAPSTKAPAPRAAVTAAQTSNIAAELRRIGIVAGIILVILVILVFVLPYVFP